MKEGCSTPTRLPAYPLVGPIFQLVYPSAAPNYQLDYRSSQV